MAQQRMNMFLSHGISPAMAKKMSDLIPEDASLHQMFLDEFHLWIEFARRNDAV